MFNKRFLSVKKDNVDMRDPVPARTASTAPMTRAIRTTGRRSSGRRAGAGDGEGGPSPGTIGTLSGFGLAVVVAAFFGGWLIGSGKAIRALR